MSESSSSCACAACQREEKAEARVAPCISRGGELICCVGEAERRRRWRERPAVGTRRGGGECERKGAARREEDGQQVKGAVLGAKQVVETMKEGAGRARQRALYGRVARRGVLKVESVGPHGASCCARHRFEASKDGSGSIPKSQNLQGSALQGRRVSSWTAEEGRSRETHLEDRRRAARSPVRTVAPVADDLRVLTLTHMPAQVGPPGRVGRSVESSRRDEDERVVCRCADALGGRTRGLWLRMTACLASCCISRVEVDEAASEAASRTRRREHADARAVPRSAHAGVRSTRVDAKGELLDVERLRACSD